MKRALRGNGKDICDYIKADQIDELIRQDVEERTRRELEHGWMARVRSGQELCPLSVIGIASSSRLTK